MVGSLLNLGVRSTCLENLANNGITWILSVLWPHFRAHFCKFPRSNCQKSNGLVAQAHYSLESQDRITHSYKPLVSECMHFIWEVAGLTLLAYMREISKIGSAWNNLGVVEHTRRSKLWLRLTIVCCYYTCKEDDNYHLQPHMRMKASGWPKNVPWTICSWS